MLESPLLSNIKVFFYGSGCTPAHVPMMKQMLGEVFSQQKVEVHSDLMAAARALYENTDLTATEIADKALHIASEICVYTNDHIIVETV